MVHPGSAQDLTMDVTTEEFVVSDEAAGPYGMVAGADGAVWFTLAGAGKIGRFAPGGAVETIDLPNPEGQPTAIIAAPDGAMWFTQTRDNSIGRVTPAGEVSIFRAPTPDAAPFGLAVGHDGALWFTEMSA